MSDEPEIREVPAKLPKYVTTQGELGKLIGAHRNTIREWKKIPESEGRPPHDPNGYHVGKWLAFGQQITKRSGVEKSNTKAEKENKKLDEQIRGLILKNDEQEKLLIPMAIINQRITFFATEVKSEVRRIKDSLPQALQGLSLPEQYIKTGEIFKGLFTKIANAEIGIPKA
jgi:hypothetical protein